MRGFLIVIAGAALLGFLGFVLVLVNTTLTIAPLQEEAEVFAEAAITDITRTWNGTALLNRATPDYASTLRSGGLEALMRDGRRRAGRMNRLQKTACSIEESGVARDDWRAICLVSAAHQRGAAEFEVTLVRRDREWRIDAFDLDVNRRGGGDP